MFQEKTQTLSTIKHQKNTVRKTKECLVDDKENHKLKSICDINYNNKLTTNDAKEHLRIAKKDLKEMKLKEKDFREQELLDLCLNELAEEFLSNEDLKKGAIWNVIKNEK